MSAVEHDVTVVLPVWDHYVERFLPEALDSILGQDLAADVIVVDNDSGVPVPDRDGVQLVRAPRRLTVGAARNLGLEAASTPFVLFWDADDVMLPGTLRALRRRFDAAPDAVAVAGAIVERPGEPHHWPRRVTRPLARWRAPFALVHAVSALFPTTGAVMIRAAAARDAGGFGDTDGGDDWVLGVSLAFRGRILLDPHAGRLYRRWPGSVSSRWRAMPDLVRHAAAVRVRLRSDPAAPGWLGPLSPALAAAQLGVIFVLRPLRLLMPRRARGAPTA